MTASWSQVHELSAAGRVDEARGLVRALLDAGSPLAEPELVLDGLLDLHRAHPGPGARALLRAFTERVGLTTARWGLAGQLARLPDETPLELEAVFAGFVRSGEPSTQALRAFARAQPERVDALLLPLRDAAPDLHAVLSAALSDDVLVEDPGPLFTRVTTSRSGTRALLVPVVIVVGVLLQLSNCNATPPPVAEQPAPAPAAVVEPSVVMLSPLDELCARARPDCAVARQVETALAAHDCAAARAAHETLANSTTRGSPSVLRAVADELGARVARCR